jgi:tetratricopeptide (TPR) repeat protein
MAANSDLLGGPIAVAHDLQRLNRLEDALAVLDSVIPHLKDPQEAKTQFKDYLFESNWVFDARADILLDLGRFEEAENNMRLAASMDELGSANVSDTLNLAALLNSEGKPTEALEALKPLAGDRRSLMDKTGRMVFAFQTASADGQLGRKDEASEALAYISAHESDYWKLALVAPLCINDEAASAAAFLRAFDDPQGRVLALEAMSQFDHHGAGAPFARELWRRLQKVTARPEVRAAAEKAGGPKTFTVRSTFD